MSYTLGLKTPLTHKEFLYALDAVHYGPLQRWDEAGLGVKLSFHLTADQRGAYEVRGRTATEYTVHPYTMSYCDIWS